MSKVVVIDSSISDSRLMSSLLMRRGYEVVCTHSMIDGKKMAIKLMQNTIIVTAMRLSDGNAVDLIKWIKDRGYSIPVIVILDLFNAADIYNVMKNHGAVDIIQRQTLDKMLVETVEGNTPHNLIDVPHNAMFQRTSNIYRKLIDKVERIAHTKLNILIVGESGVGKEPLAEEIHRLSTRSDKPCIRLDASVLHLQDHKHKILYEGIRNKLVKAAGGTVIIAYIIHILMISANRFS